MYRTVSELSRPIGQNYNGYNMRITTLAKNEESLYYVDGLIIVILLYGLFNS